MENMEEKSKRMSGYLQVKSGVEVFKYSEPKVLTYLFIAILLLLFFIFTVEYEIMSINKKMSSIEADLKILTDKSVTVINSWEQLSSKFNITTEAVNIIVSTVEAVEK